MDRGRLLEWHPGAARADGLDGAAVGDRVEIEGSGPALVTGLASDHVQLAPLSSIAPKPGASVVADGPLTVPAGEELIGRSVDALGRPLDGKALGGLVHHRIFFPPPPLRHESRSTRLTMGLLVYDLKHVIRLGSNVLLEGDAAPVARHLLRHQAHEGRVAIYALLAPGSSTMLASAVYDRVDGTPRSNHLVIEPGIDPTPAALALIPWTAMAIATHFKEQGREAVVVLDSLDRWRAVADAFLWQGSWLSQFGRLLGLSTALPARGSVSLVALATPKLAVSAGPLFDLTLDVKRALHGTPVPDGGSFVRPPIKVKTMSLLGRPIGDLNYLEAFEKSPRPAPLSAEVLRAFALRRYLTFRTDLPVDLVEQLVVFLAASEVPEFTARHVDLMSLLLARIRKDHAGLLAEIRKRGEYRDEDHAVLMATARQLAAATGKA